MRLQPREIEAIRTAVREVFGATATIRVFGSRIRDDLKGGDVDLFVEVEPGQASIANEQRLRDRIAPAIDDLRTDIILHERGTALTPIEQIALRDGLLLCGPTRPRSSAKRFVLPRAVPDGWRGLKRFSGRRRSWRRIRWP